MVARTTTAVGTTTATMSGMITTGTTTTIAAITTVAVLIQMAIEIAAMAIMISAITSVDVTYALASTKEPMIVHLMKAIAVWNMTLPTAHRV